MIGLVGAHFDVLVVAGFGLFSLVLGGVSLVDALKG